MWLKHDLCGTAKLCFNAKYELQNTISKSRKEWKARTIALEGIHFKKHPTMMNELLNFDPFFPEYFNVHTSPVINAINNETVSADERAYLFRENPILEDKINSLIESMVESGDTTFKLKMPADLKDAKKKSSQKRTRD